MAESRLSVGRALAGNAARQAMRRRSPACRQSANIREMAVFDAHLQRNDGGCHHASQTSEPAAEALYAPLKQPS